MQPFWVSHLRRLCCVADRDLGGSPKARAAGRFRLYGKSPAYLNPRPSRYHRVYWMISLKGVSKHYDGKRKVIALDSVDLEIGAGEMVSIVKARLKLV